MILAADVGGSKTLVGSSSRRDRVRSSWPMRARAHARLRQVCPTCCDAALGPLDPRVDHGVARRRRADPRRRATLTNVPWQVRRAEIVDATGGADVRLLNDLEAMALRRAGARRRGAAHAAGRPAVGRRQRRAHRRRHRPRRSHPAPRRRPDACRCPPRPATPTSRRAPTTSWRSCAALRARFGRVDVEHVVSGPGLVNIARHAHAGAALRGHRRLRRRHGRRRSRGCGGGVAGLRRVAPTRRADLRRRLRRRGRQSGAAGGGHGRRLRRRRHRAEDAAGARRRRVPGARSPTRRRWRRCSRPSRCTSSSTTRQGSSAPRWPSLDAAAVMWRRRP